MQVQFSGFVFSGWDIFYMAAAGSTKEKKKVFITGEDRILASLLSFEIKTLLVNDQQKYDENRSCHK